ncbi:MAG: tryptophan 2,3-dioxygenase family protein, partial [Phenylobacterium sp.]|nr:tryptophan 2,3-dioxygenase family protein [Phenylobacterium sp.]
FLLGGKSTHALSAHDGKPEVRAQLEAALAEPSIYDETLRLLARRGLLSSDVWSQRDWSQPHTPSADVEEAWLAVYRDPDKWWDLYELAEKLVDLEFRFQQWRFAHMKTVQRIIGGKSGTGGSSGVAYLGRALERSFFPELLDMRSSL